MLGPQRRWLGAAAVAAAVTLGAGVGLVSTSAGLISRAALVSTTTTLALSITFVRLFAVLRAAGRYVERYVGHLATFRVLTRVRVWCFRSMIRVGPRRLGRERRGDLLNRVVDDVETTQDLYLRVLVPPLAAVSTTVIAALVLGSAAPAAGVLGGAVLAAGCVLLPLLAAGVGRRPAEQVTQGRAARNAEVTEALAGLDELLVLGEEDRVSRLVATRDAEVMLADRRLGRARGFSDASASLLGPGLAVALAALGTALVREGDLSGVDLALLPLVGIAAAEAVTPLVSVPNHLHRSRAAARRLFALADEAPAVIDAEAPLPLPRAFDITLDGVAFRYRGGADVLSGVDLHIPEGSWVAVSGPSGAGKSTLVGLLNRAVDPDRGAVRLGGTDLKDLRSADLHRAVAVVAQQDHLFDTTIRDNLLLADPDADDDRLFEALDDAGLGDAVRALPEGLDERVGERAGRLSGGERQRLLIARALLRDAPVLVMDEATAHLDTVTERKVLAAVSRRRRGLTTILVAHHAAALDGVDLVVEVSAGRCRTQPEGHSAGVGSGVAAEVGGAGGGGGDPSRRERRWR